jgi:hypothetical protein
MERMVKMRTSIARVEVKFAAVEVDVEDEIDLQIEVDAGNTV